MDDSDEWFKVGEFIRLLTMVVNAEAIAYYLAIFDMSIGEI